MRKALSAKVESRRKNGERNSGPYGSFLLTHPDGARLQVIASDGRDWADCGLPGGPWEHVSVSLPTRCPTWAEMDWVKRLFWEDDEVVLQLHVPRRDHISIHNFCLHLWRPVGVELPLPPREAV
jgi:hypothetical protein